MDTVYALSLNCVIKITSRPEALMARGQVREINTVGWHGLALTGYSGCPRALSRFCVLLQRTSVGKRRCLSALTWVTAATVAMY